MQSSLVLIPHKKTHARIRIFCFPYAGGGVATYLTWIDLLPDVEIAIVQLPGRGNRLIDPPYQTMESMVRDLFTALSGFQDKPFIFFGHSMGARVAYELTLMLYRANAKLPNHFIASGSSAPFIPRKKEILHLLPDSEFIEKIGALNGTPKEILENKEIMQLILPMLRADFKIIETYCNKSKIVLPTTVSVLAGTEDLDEPDDTNGWLELFKYNTGIIWIQGDHFFIEKNLTDTMEAVNRIISPIDRGRKILPVAHLQ